MDIISRSAVILRPKKPFLDWCKLDDKEGLAEGVFEALHAEPNVHLVPEWEEPEEGTQVMRESWPALFERMLMAWVTDAALWPRDRTQAMFEQWFEVETYSLVDDVCGDEAIEYLT